MCAPCPGGSQSHLPQRGQPQALPHQPPPLESLSQPSFWFSYLPDFGRPSTGRASRTRGDSAMLAARARTPRAAGFLQLSRMQGEPPLSAWPPLRKCAEGLSLPARGTGLEPGAPRCRGQDGALSGSRSPLLPPPFLQVGDASHSPGEAAQRPRDTWARGEEVSGALGPQAGCWKLQTFAALGLGARSPKPGAAGRFPLQAHLSLRLPECGCVATLRLPPPPALGRLPFCVCGRQETFFPVPVLLFFVFLVLTRGCVY